MTIHELLNAPEGENVEFKEAKHSFEFNKLLRYACAIANSGGGRIVLGVTDRRPREVVGSDAFDQPERTRAGLREQLHIRVDFEILCHEGKQVLVFQIARRPSGLPVHVDGVAWWRDGDSLIPMPEAVRSRIYAETGHDFSADICPGATFADLDPAAVQAFCAKWAQKTGNDRLKHLPEEQLLRDCEAVTGDGVTYAALVLFGNHASLGRFLAQSETVFEYRASDASGPAQQREEFRLGFFAYCDRIWELINLRNDIQHYQDGLFIFDIPTFNDRVVREALLNAICHRNYQFAGSVFIRQYRDRLVVESPGGFPPDITVENILDRQSPRNRRIAEILARCGLVERSGQGMNLIYEICVKEAKALPDFAGTDAHGVRLTLNGLVLDKNLLSVLNKIGAVRLESFATDDFLLINSLFYKQTVPAHLQSRIKHLVDVGIVEHVGRKKFVLARAFYAATKTRGTRTRLVGLDRATNKELLIRHIRECGSEGTPFCELQQVLPGHSRSQIRTLLHHLQSDGLVRVDGTTSAARWFLCHPKTEGGQT